ncbi:hypothetical protein QBC39DRAFT_392276 [Podospora conica]|nr:hypothetical protein QBC39DRAFT_392276 [Schizothecium conicum]
MAGSSSARMELANGAPRNSSMDSAVSALSSSRSTPNKGPQENAPGTPDIAHLIKTAGSPEAVIQYLLKEKASQAQQNAQLWRLVDKQRAMILGLNKDLSRAVEDKKKYKQKLKELVIETDFASLPAVPAPRAAQGAARNASITSEPPIQERTLDAPLSPVDSDSQKHSPVNVAMAPYPITPPADHPGANGLHAAVGEILDPSHAMPKPSEHALGQFDHDEQEHEAEKARKRADEASDLRIDLGIPSSRTTAPPPPRMPPPQLPVPAHPQRLSSLDDGIGHFPPPPAPPPRKPPPAPLHLKNLQQQSPTIPLEEDLETDTDYDDILEVDEIANDDRRGRRRTRAEDEREREILAFQEAERRSLSKKSKKSSRATTPKEEVPPTPKPEPPQSARMMPVGKPPRETASLAGILSGTAGPPVESRSIPMPLLSPGLPSSPRPMGLRSPVNSPPLSPLGVSTFSSGALSPRAPRAPIPLPPNTQLPPITTLPPSTQLPPNSPLQTPSPVGDPLVLRTPKPLNIVKKDSNSIDSPASPTKSSSAESAAGRTRVFRGLMTEEYPDLLLPPNALPSIDIRVASSRMKPSRASLLSLTQLEEDPVFTLAILSRSDGGELWRVEKDSASLAKLDQRLKLCPAFTAKTPDRSLFSGHAPAKLDARRVALNHYLDELLNTELDPPTAIELCRYLSTNTLAPNSDETGSSLTESNPESTEKVVAGGRPFRTGYLTKRGKNFGGWKARFFILDGPHLKYYETPGGAHLGTIKLPKAQIGKQSQHGADGSPARGPSADDADNQYRHAFLILEPKKKDPTSVTKHVLCAESDMERDQWVDALLRWIDYRDPEEEEASKKETAAHDRQGSNTSDRVNGRKKQQGRGVQRPNPTDESLIGVSYEATRQGDIPQGAPPSAGLTMSSQSAYAISAPRDPQVISNTEAWGTKLGMGLAPPNQEEKKARKRSFFGFGPKTRSSSDGNDSLFGNENGGGGNGQGGGQFNNPVRQVFGASLAEAVRYNSPVDVKVPLPAVVYRCIQYLDAKNAINEEGIFRLSGSNLVIKQLKERFNNEGDINLITDPQYHDIHAVASLLKMYLRELPNTILTSDLRLEFIGVTEMTNVNDKIAALSELVERLPQANGALLKYLIAFLIKIISHADSNKMTVRNVGIVFSPTLNIPAPVFAMFLQNYEAIFGIHPTEYELPTTEEGHERHPERPSFQERRPSDGRPSTSHSDSPHRQRLMEAVMEGQASRSSPTPPPMTMQQRQTSYEPSFLAQQNVGAGSHVSMRPAYESGFVVPPGYDLSQIQTPTGFKANPGYDQPVCGWRAADGRRGGIMSGAANQQSSRTRTAQAKRTWGVVPSFPILGVGVGTEGGWRRAGSSGPVTPEDDAAAGDPNDPKKHRACESCRGLKVRCEPNPDGEPDPDGPNPDGPCKRCAKAGRQCVVIQPTRKRQKKTDNRVAELEKKIDALTATLQATQATRTTMVLQPGPSSRPGSSDVPDPFSPTGASARDADSVAGSSTTAASGAGRDWNSQGRERSSSTVQRSPATKNMSSYGTIDINVGGYSPPHGGGMKRKHGVSGPPGPPRPETPEEGPDIVDRGLLNMEQAEMLFKRYTTQMAPHLPAVVFPADMTAADLRVEKPILFHAVMAVASAEITSIQRALTKELMQLFAESIVIIGRKSLELVQALQVAVIWYWPPEAFEELKFYQLVHIGAIMAIDIGLGRKTQANSGFRQHMPQGDHPLKKNAPPDSTTIEARRTWLACYFLATNTAMALHRPNLIRWTPFMAECVQVLESSDEAAPTDKYLTHLIWTHKLAEEVSVLLSMDDTSSTPNIADARTQYALKGFERDLESYRESIPKELQQRRLAVLLFFVEETSKPPFSADYPFRQPPPPSANGSKLTAAHVDAISECLAAIEGIFEVFLSMEATSIRCLPVYNFVRVAYAAVVLMKMFFAASSEKSSLGKVINKDDIKVEQHLEKLLAKFKETAADDKSRPAAKFLVVLIMLHSWFQKQKYVLHGPAAPRAKGAGAQPPSSRQSPEKGAGPDTPVEYPPTANTPLQLLSEFSSGAMDWSAMNEVAGGFGMMQDGVRFMMQEPPWFGPLQQMGIPLNGLPGMHMMVPVDGMGRPLGPPGGGPPGGPGGGPPGGGMYY